MFALDSNTLIDYVKNAGGVAQRLRRTGARGTDACRYAFGA